MRLLLLTGCRAGEITGMTWREVEGGADGGQNGYADSEGMRVTLADSKTGSRTVWFGSAAAHILMLQCRPQTGQQGFLPRG